MNILVTGASGFVGKNLIATLQTKNHTIFKFEKHNNLAQLDDYCAMCDFVVHLAGVNRPTLIDEFYEGNVSLTEKLCESLRKHNNKAPVLLSSSIHVTKDDDYGKSKKIAEQVLLEHSELNASPVYIYRLANLFGKWCRPNYNSVVATWCNNIANSLEIQVNDPDVVLSLCYIDDVVEEFVHAIDGKPNLDDTGYAFVSTVHEVSLDTIKNLLYSFKRSRDNFFVPNTGDAFVNKLYATYLSYLPKEDFAHNAKMNVNQGGSFTELFKTAGYGQVSVSISKPGVTKGNHWHHTKNEKFVVVSGKGVIRFRNLGTEEVIAYHVSEDKIQIVDIPTGYTHNIENLGDKDLVTIMWASEPFQPEKPDTIFLEV